jgi:hypothetical protein
MELENSNNNPASTGDIIDLQDSANDQLTAAMAIIDCVRVLTTLERAEMPPGDPSIGRGYVGGDTVRDSSMPVALHHAMELIKSAKSATNQIAKYITTKAKAE